MPLSVSMSFLAVIILLIASVAGLVLTLLTLPGVWLILAIALICQFAFGDPLLFSWWTLGIALALALLGEAAEFAASAIGAAGAGGGTSGAFGSIVGSTVGAIVGTFIIPIPIAGTIAGGVLGAGIGAVAAERGITRRPWGQSCRIGRGAAIGRLLATIAKLVIAAAVGILLTLAVVF
jgi:uncharacterized protein